MDKPTVPEVIPLLRQYYALPGNGMGGSLHIIIEDGNTQDWHVQACLDSAIERCDEMGAKLAAMLLSMSRTQRKKLYAIGGFYPR